MSHRTATSLTLVLTCTILQHTALQRASGADPDTPTAGSIAERYREAAERIVSATLAGNDAYDKLEHLCVHVGHRLSGSAALEEAIDWALDTMRTDGQKNVHREKVMVPHWVRGNESAAMVSPRYVPFHMLGLGGSVATPAGGITAPVIVVSDEDGLNAVADLVEGKIVLFNKVMPPYDPTHGAGYGATVKYRSQGARLAAEKGAVAALIRSVTANSLRTPHTGAMRYGDAKKKIPTAAISVEDAELLSRLQKRGITPVVSLRMNAKTLPDAMSGNAIGELRGTVAGAHELLKLAHQIPRPRGAEAGLAVLSLLGDERTVCLEERCGGRRLCRSRLEGFGDLLPAHSNEVRKTEARTRLVLRPRRQVHLRLDVLNPAIPGRAALAVTQPSMKKLQMVRSHCHRRKPIRQWKVGGLAVAEKGLG